MLRRDFLAMAAGAPLTAAKSFDPDFGSGLEAAAAIATKRISPDELTQHVMRRIARLDPKLNSICWKFDPSVKGNDQGVFGGVPMNVKESFGVAGSPATYGMVENKDYRSKNNAVAVQRMLGGGARIVAKTNVPVRLLDWQSYNPVYGTTNNPWDTALTCGGSSGGSAAGLAAGFGFMSLGSDIGGSLRIPSHFCGTCAHKPSLELVPRRGHAAGPVSDSPYAVPTDLSVVGPMTRHARDLAAMMRLLAGPEDLYRWEAPKPRHTSLRDFRVGYMFEDAKFPLSPASAPVVEEAISRIGKAGMKLDKGWPTGIDPHQSVDLNMALLYSAVGFTDEKHALWLRQNSERFKLRYLWQEYFKTHDVFVCPVAFREAFPHQQTGEQSERRIDGREYMDLRFWQHFPIVTGLPSTVVQAGRTKAGLPVGIQIIGPYLEDFTPIEFGTLLEPILGGFVKPPLFA